MKIRILNANVFTQFGAFSRGDVLDEADYSNEFFNHLLNQVRCAEVIEAKIINPVIENKQVPAKKKRGRPKKHS